MTWIRQAAPILLVAAALACARSPAVDEMPESRIAIVSFQQVYERYERTKEVKKKIDQLKAKIRELKQKHDALMRVRARLLPDKGDIKPENLDEIIENIRQVTKIQIEMKRAIEETKQRNQALAKEISGEIIAMIREVAQRRGFNIVLNYVEPKKKELGTALEKFAQESNRTFPYTNGRDDLTGDVIRRLNTEWKKRQSVK